MSNELNTEILNLSTTSCFTHEGNQLLNINNTNKPLILEKPILKRGVHINEDLGLADPKEQEEDSNSLSNWIKNGEQDSESLEEENSDSLSNWTKNGEQDEDAKAQLQEYLLEQQQDDLVWSPFGQRLVTPKDFETFEARVEPIVKKQQQEQKQAHQPQNKEISKNPLFKFLNTKYRNKAEQIEAILQRQEQEAFDKYLKEANEATTFTDFADLTDCFEAMDEEEEEEKQEEQKNTNSDPKRNWTKCSQLQELLDVLPDRLSKPTDKRYLQEWFIIEQVWHEEHRRITIEHTESCEYCQSIPPKKLKRCDECNCDECNTIVSTLY
jgi:hypothetical protein